MDESRPDLAHPMPSDRLSKGWLVLGLAAFASVALLIYAPALRGAFIADDQHYIQLNPYVHEFSWDHFVTLWDPTGPLLLTVENYAPVHILLHALEWQLFGNSTTGYHVVNAAVHAVVSLLLVMVFARSGIPLRLAGLGGVLFLVHPANVEAVAWISQLKTTASMALGLGALLCHPRRPAWGAVLFVLALLAKPTAAVFLPVVVLLGVTQGVPEGRRLAAWRWGWLVLWLAAFVGFAVLELWAFSQTAGTVPPVYPDLGVRARSLVANAGRYLVMSATGTGLSAFHEPPPAESWLDPWWIGSLLALALLGWRCVVVLAQRRVEAAYWAWAIVSFLPISGLIPLPFPVADRYLYFMLPGLLGAAALALPDLLHRLQVPDARNRAFRTGAFGVGVALAFAFAVAAHARAAIWSSGALLMADAELHYPEGKPALLSRARRAAQRGDLETALRDLEKAAERGYDRLDYLMREPAFSGLQGDPRFRALLRGIAQRVLERYARNPSPSQVELHAIAQAHIAAGDLAAAIRALERALAAGGPFDEIVRRDLENLRR